MLAGAGLVVLLTAVAVFPYHVSTGLTLAILISLPMAIWLKGRRRVVALAAVAVIAITGICLVDLFAMTTIHVRNDSNQPIRNLTIVADDDRWITLFTVAPGVEGSVRFFGPFFHGPMEAYGRMDGDAEAHVGCRSEVPARRFRTYVSIHITSDGQLHVSTR